MARVIIKLGKNECIHDVREKLLKALADDDVLEAIETYDDELMEDLVHEAEKSFSKMYLEIVKQIILELKTGL